MRHRPLIMNKEDMETLALKCREKYGNMSKEEIEFETRYIIEFEDYGQDFLEWHINKEGYVIDSRPFQRSIWTGTFTVPETAFVGGLLAVWVNGESHMNYPIKKIMKVKDGKVIQEVGV